MFPNLPNGHLYQWITTCGTLLAVSSIVGIVVLINSHNKLAYEAAAQLLANDSSPAAQRFWTSSFQEQKNNTTFYSAALFVASAFGLLVAIGGGYCWFRNVQWYEDEERRFDHSKRARDLNESVARSKIQVSKLILPCAYCLGTLPQATDFSPHRMQTKQNYPDRHAI
jgi:hypothetical protein